jgi:hypothetical protein
MEDLFDTAEQPVVEKKQRKKRELTEEQKEKQRQHLASIRERGIAARKLQAQKQREIKLAYQKKQELEDMEVVKKFRPATPSDEQPTHKDPPPSPVKAVQVKASVEPVKQEAQTDSRQPPKVHGASCQCDECDQHGLTCRCKRCNPPKPRKPRQPKVKQSVNSDQPKVDPPKPALTKSDPPKQEAKKQEPQKQPPKTDHQPLPQALPQPKVIKVLPPKFSMGRKI